MFTTLIVQPVFNLLVLIYALIPGHNFGLAIILFTIAVRILMWPMIKKQLHHTKAMRQLQPELKRIKQEAKGDRRKESMMMMELYKERDLNPFASIGLVILQIPIFIGLYSGLNRLVKDTNEIVNFSYPFIRELSWIKELSADISKFDSTLFGAVDLTRSALEKGGGVYWPAMIMVIGSAVIQYYQSKQLMPNDKDARSLRTLLKEAGSGKQADSSEVNAAVGRSTRYLIPSMIFIVTINLPASLALYWLVGGLIAFWQQARILGEEEQDLEKAASRFSKKDAKKSGKNVAAIAEAEIVEAPVVGAAGTQSSSSQSKKSSKNNRGGKKKKSSKKRRR